MAEKKRTSLKFSEAAKRRWSDPEYRQKIIESHKGYRFSEERKNSFSKMAKDKKFGKWMIGRKGGQAKNKLVWRRKLSLSKKGERNPQWKGGLTEINSVIRNSLEYKLWREAVFKRDNYTCVWCGIKSGQGKEITFNADHIKPFYLYPELRFSIDNGRTLCLNCHMTTETWGRPKQYGKRKTSYTT